VAIALGFGLAALTFGACLAAVLQNYLAANRGTPTWLTPAVSALAGIVVGAILIGAIAAPGTTAATSTINDVPAVHLGPGNFDQTAITIPVGSKLVFANDAGIPHILAYGSWDQGRAHGASQPAGAPPLNDLRISSGDITTGPFTMAGTYHIYCLIHPGMNLTVTVQ
jgi:plastocyanin